MFKYSYLERKFHCSQWGKKHRMFTKWHNDNDVGLLIWRSMIVRDYGIGDSQEWARKLGNAIAISLKQSIHTQQAKLHNRKSWLLRTFKRKFRVEKTVAFMEKMLNKGHSVPARNEEISCSGDSVQICHVPHFRAYPQRSWIKFEKLLTLP